MKLVLAVVTLAIVSYALASMLFSLSGFLGLFAIAVMSVFVLIPQKKKR